MARMARTWAMSVALTALTAATPSLAQNQRITGPTATYWATAQTEVGMTQNGPQRSLLLQLSASRTTPEPAAEHLPPPGLGVGASLPLATPDPATARTLTEVYEQSQATPDYSSGSTRRMLIYWGCGEATRQGQPVVIDLKAPDAPSRMERVWANLSLSTPAPPMPGDGRTYGAWPHGTANAASIPVTGSLVGDHRVRGNYTPDINFSLAAGQDFLAPLQINGLAGRAQGAAAPMSWNAVSGAQGYFASVIGANAENDMVLWTSSESAVMMLPEHLPQADLERLARQKVILSPTTTQCAIPAAVADAAPQSMLRLIAYGDEVNASYPPRPADRRTPWNIDYSVKVRFASTAMSMLTPMEMGPSGQGVAGTPGAEAAQPAQTPSVLDALPVPGGQVGRAVARGLGGLLRGRN